MMGERTVLQESLFYSFSLEGHVPQGHLLRAIDRFVDLGAIREHLRPYYSETGRPSGPSGLPPTPAMARLRTLLGWCTSAGSRRTTRGLGRTATQGGSGGPAFSMST